MKDLKLVFPTEKHKEEWYCVLKEMQDANEDITPLALTYEANNYEDYLRRVYNNSNGINLPKDRVHADVFFLVKEGQNRILGTIDIRYGLNECLYNYGGNIGYSVRPTERKKGYATEMLSLALDICKEKGMNKVLMTCDKDNIGSAKTMMKNGAVFENEVHDGRALLQRYWVKL